MRKGIALNRIAMDNSKFDNDTNPSDKDYFAFVKRLAGLAAVRAFTYASQTL